MDLAPHLGMRARDPEDLLRRAPVNARRLLAPELLSEALLDYANRHGAPEPVLENARAVADGAYMIVAGQQPGLLGGPLFTIYKAATAVRLARDLNQLPGAPKVVPVFWNHTDDHDLDEVNRAFLVNGNQDVQRLRLDLQHQGEPIRNLKVGRLMEEVLGPVAEILPDSEFRTWALDAFTPRHPDETLGAPMARLLYSMFGRDGILVIEPRDLPAEAFETLPRWWEMATELRAQVRSACDHLGDMGLDVTMDPGATMMFQVAGNRRVPLADGEVAQRATDLSPGAMLRPLWQDACLPTLGFVVGPGELAYLSVVGPLYRTLGVPSPVLVPRASLTLVEKSLQKLLKRFGWDVSDLGQGPESLTAATFTEGEAGIEQEMDELAADIERRFATFTQDLSQADKQMVSPAERTRTKVVDEITKLATKLRNSRQDREGNGLRQIRRLCSNLRPRGRLQERVLPVLPFLVAHGQELADHLVEAADPFGVEHGILEL